MQLGQSSRSFLSLRSLRAAGLPQTHFARSTTRDDRRRTRAQRVSGSAIGFQLVTVAIMCGLLALYVALHRSSLRGLIATLAGEEFSAAYVSIQDLVPARNVSDQLAAIVLVAIGLLAAWYLTDAIELAHYERPLAFGLTTLAFVVIPAAGIGGLAAWTGTALLRPPIGPLLAATPAVAVALVGMWRGWRPRLPVWPQLGRIRPLVWLVWGLALALLLESCALSLTHPPTGYDALAYHAPLANFLWRDGNLGSFLDRNPHAWPLAQPGTAELWFGLLLLAGGERLADLGQLPFALLGAAAVYAVARRLGLRPGAALLAAGAFLLAPLVIVQAGTQLNDLTGAALLMTTVALACAPTERWCRGRLILLGVGLGLATTTKLALVPPVAATGILVLGALLRRHRLRPTRAAVLERITIVSLGFLVVVMPWWIRNMAHYGNPIFPAALPLVGRGISQTEQWMVPLDNLFVARRAYWVIYPLIEPHSEQSGFGALMVVGAMPGMALAALRGRRRHLVSGYLLIAAFTLPAWWGLTRHEPRFLLSLFGLGFAVLPWTLLSVNRRWRWLASAVLATAAVISAATTFAQAFAPIYGDPLSASVQRPYTRAEFYDQVWGVDPAVASLPQTEGIVLAGHAYTAYYPLLGDSLGRLVLVEKADAPIDFLMSRMRSVGVRYAYVSELAVSPSAAEVNFDATRFIMERESIGTEDDRLVRRYLFRLKPFAAQ